MSRRKKDHPRFVTGDERDAIALAQAIAWRRT